MSCSSCGVGNLKHIGDFVPGNTIPAWIAARNRAQGKSLSPMQIDAANVMQSRIRAGLGVLTDPLGGALGSPLISGIPNVYLAGLALVLVMVLKK